MDNSVLIVLFLFATVLLRLALVLLAVWLLIPRRRHCPHCGETTTALVGPWIVRLTLLERRWCMECGWTGIAKRTTRRRSDQSSPTIPAAGLLFVVVLYSGCAAPAPTRDEVAALFGDDAAWVDLTHSFDQQAIYWPTAEPFKLTKVADGVTPKGYYYAANNFSAAEHGGTHLDAPVHFAAGKHTTDAIPLGKLVGPAAVVDVKQRTAGNPDYLVVRSDVEAWESAHGRLPNGAIVLFRTGWGSRWPDRKSYLGTEASGAAAVPQLHFPGIDSSLTRWLVTERSVDAIGIDTPSIDYGQSGTYDTHQILFAANVPAFENVANLDQVPETGAYVVALPMKIAGGSGGPLRIIAAVPHRK